MRNTYIKPLLIIGLVTVLSVATQAQVQLMGSILDSKNNEGVASATVSIKGTTNATLTDIDGFFLLEIDTLPATLVFSHLAYESAEIEILDTEEELIIRAIPKDFSIPVSVVGSRFKPRTNITSAVPIDNIAYIDLLATGQQTLDKMMMYAIPSFNSTQQTISDATAHFDPMDLRGLGPSRTLILVNGKRKNPSALVYINDTPGKGEVGVDMKTIPAAAIERVEVLRDGASAQYGSDAIAGVINIVLKKDCDFVGVNTYSGVSLQGDGFHLGANTYTGFQIGEEGYMSLAANFYRQNETNRAGTPGRDGLFGIEADDPVWGDWLAENPDLGMTVGQPEITQANLMLNFRAPLTKWLDVYSFGGFTYRDNLSYALYRTPYWVSDPNNLLHDPAEEYNGFQPTFESEVYDHNFTLGFGDDTEDWKYDISATTGSNSVDYLVNRSLNQTLGANSPTSFYPGGYSFFNLITNADVAHQRGIFTFALGGEYRMEMFAARAGEEASYIGEGAQSFPGIEERNSIGFDEANRYNLGAYVEVTAEFLKNKNLLIGGAGRLENYSDFGLNYTWKANARYKFLKDKVSFRGSVSTGFRAPSLHQSYLSIAQTLVSGGTISNQGTFNNFHPVIMDLEVPQLQPETAFNITGGLAANPTKKTFVSLDFYQIAVDDRIVYSSSISSFDTTTTVGRILDDYNITSLKFFTNAANTLSRGLDFVFEYKGLSLGKRGGMLSFSLALNLNRTEIVGTIATPSTIQEAGVDIFDRKEQSRIISARPLSKGMLGLTYLWKDLRIHINNTRFGAVTWQHGSNPDFDQTFSPKVITDLQVQYQITPSFFMGLYVNNMLNVYPDAINTFGDPVTDLGGRFVYPWEVNQFGFMGTNFSLYLGFRFAKKTN